MFILFHMDEYWEYIPFSSSVSVFHISNYSRTLYYLTLLGVTGAMVADL